MTVFSLPGFILLWTIFHGFRVEKEANMRFLQSLLPLSILFSSFSYSLTTPVSSAAPLEHRITYHDPNGQTLWATPTAHMIDLLKVLTLIQAVHRDLNTRPRGDLGSHRYYIYDEQSDLGFSMVQAFNNRLHTAQIGNDIEVIGRFITTTRMYKTFSYIFPSEQDLRTPNFKGFFGIMGPMNETLMTNTTLTVE